MVEVHLIKLPQHFQDKLRGEPESGMGYQIVVIILKDDRRIKNLLVFNGIMLQLPERYKNINVQDIKDIEMQV